MAPGRTLPFPNDNAFWNACNRVVQYYENFIGATEIRAAQQKVLQAEEEFVEKQRLRRENQESLDALQNRYRELQVELERTPRADDRYLILVTEEHKLIKEERALMNNFHKLESMERESFGLLSARLRESHQRERERAERTKYWSLIGSVFGAVVGTVASQISNRRKMCEIRNLVRDSSAESGGLFAVQKTHNEFLRSQRMQNEQLLTKLKNMFGLVDDDDDDLDDSLLHKLRSLIVDEKQTRSVQPWENRILATVVCGVLLTAFVVCFKLCRPD